MFDKNALFSPLKPLAVAGGGVNLLLSARKVGTFASRVGESAALVGGEDGGVAAEPALETEQMDAVRATSGRLERKGLTASMSGEMGTVLGVVALWRGVFSERKERGKGMW